MIKVYPSRYLSVLFLSLGLVSVCATLVSGADRKFSSAWPQEQRVWIGPEYWANRLQDWRVNDGRLECLSGYANKPMRTVHLLTHRLGEQQESLVMSVRTGLIDASNRFEGAAFNAGTGFLIGAGGRTMDYRAAALVHHSPGPAAGFFVGVNGRGKPFVLDFEEPLKFGEKPPLDAMLPADRKTEIHRGVLNDVTITVTLAPQGDQYQISVSAINHETGEDLGTTTVAVAAERVVGNLALVSHPGGEQKSARYWFRDWNEERRKFEKWAGATARFWYRDWKISGGKLEPEPDHAVGPVLSTQYTLHQGTLRLTAQFFPVGEADASSADLELFEVGRWSKVANAEIVTPGYTATFVVPDLNPRQSLDYRVVYRNGPTEGDDSQGASSVFSGTIQKDPVDRETITVAAFTGNMMARGGYEYPLPYGVDPPFAPELEGEPVEESSTYLWDSRVYFPHLQVVANVAKHEPNLLFFSGDQVYEGNPTRAVEAPEEEAELDYLYKWYLWCWTWRDLTRRIPTVTIPDDHDVYQRNIWGDGGEFVVEGDLDGSYGGYFMSRDWINMIQRTQTSHLPEPFLAEPVKNGIETYFTTLIVGEIGFAILEDRKFKSFPNIVEAEMSRDSHITESDYDIQLADVEGATLLGEAQLEFLDAFARDWTGQQMKAVLSQTIFANLQILNPRNDGVPQKFDIPLDRDLDSNGWPQTGRHKALQAMRKGFMFHIAGDQHLASVIHHGTDQWEDAAWSFCVPSVANYYARSWNPKFPPENVEADLPPFMGRYRDGFNNRLTIHAVANPVRDGKPEGIPEPTELHGEMPGYGVIKFNKRRRVITVECWPRYVDPTDARTGSMYAGWPLTIGQWDNFAFEAKAKLPNIVVDGIDRPVIEVIRGGTNELVYAVRNTGSSFQAPVPDKGRYSVRVGDPDLGLWKALSGLQATEQNDRLIKVEF